MRFTCAQRVLSYRTYHVYDNNNNVIVIIIINTKMVLKTKKVSSISLVGDVLPLAVLANQQSKSEYAHKH